MPKMTSISFMHTTYGKPQIRIDRRHHYQGIHEAIDCPLTMKEAMLVCKWAEDYIRSHNRAYFSLYPCGFYMAVKNHMPKQKEVDNDCAGSD